ncbi:MAG: hypothetical protein FJ356_04120 [Thaumarchaeota archaeon]|nr:hypothetical protein [Nitrososphaerota archaeon]
MREINSEFKNTDSVNLESVEPVAEPAAVEPVAPVVEAPAPVVEAPAPVVEAPAPVVEAPAPGLTVTLYSTKNLHHGVHGKLIVGVNVVKKDSADFWLKTKKVRIATPDEIANA